MLSKIEVLMGECVIDGRKVVAGADLTAIVASVAAVDDPAVVAAAAAIAALVARGGGELVDAGKALDVLLDLHGALSAQQAGTVGA
jgi:hypothetical protein